MRYKKMPTAVRVRDRLKYDARTGVFTWAVTVTGHVKKGAVAGSKTAKGYISIFVDGMAYTAHRLAWLVSYGVPPAGDIDHKNCDRLDNRISNLRIATAKQNAANRRSETKNSSGIRGVYWNKKLEKWTASICTDYVSTHLGCFKNKEDAIKARKAAEKKYHVI